MDHITAALCTLLPMILQLPSPLRPAISAPLAACSKAWEKQPGPCTGEQGSQDGLSHGSAGFGPASSPDRHCHLSHLSPAPQGPLCSCSSHRGVMQELIIKSIISSSVKSEEILSCRSGVIFHNFPQLEARGWKTLPSLTGETVSKQQLVKDCRIHHRILLSPMHVL